MTDNSLVIVVSHPDALTELGIAADRQPSNVIKEYQERIAANTVRRQTADLRSFESFLQAAWKWETNEHLVLSLATNIEHWRGVNGSLVENFVKWLLKTGYAIGTVNIRLSTVKRYAKLACKAKVIDEATCAQIKMVDGYSHKQSLNKDREREVTRIVRPGAKKAESVSFSKEHAAKLKDQPDTPQGRRDALLMCLLLDHGLRCGEVAGLKVTDFDLKAKTFTFYRAKVGKIQTHLMTKDTFQAATAYFKSDVPAVGALLLGSRREGATGKSGGKLEGAMSTRAINGRVGVLGNAIGIDRLSPHDCRHYWATRAARNKTDLFALQDAGGWNSLAMPRRYVESAKIANEGVKLD